MLFNENITEKDLVTVHFWLTNILRSLFETEKMQDLTRELAKRCGLIVIDKPALGERSEPPTAVLGEAATEKTASENIRFKKCHAEKYMEREGRYAIREEVLRVPKPYWEENRSWYYDTERERDEALVEFERAATK